MADNSSIPVASGNETFANKDIGGVKHPKHIQVDGTGTEVAIATSAKQDTGNTSLTSIDGKTPALGQALAAASVPVILPSATITTLTPPTTITANLGTIAGAATSALQTSGNASLTTIAGAVSSSKVATKAASGDFADGALATLGAKTDAKSTATDATAVTAMQVFKQISAYLAGSLTVATHAVTQSGSWVLAAGSALIGKVQISDGTNHAAVKAASTAAALTDPAMVVALRPDSTADIFAEYETVAASQTDQVLGATGATGDYLAGVLIIPATAAAGAVSIKDGSGSAITIFVGGGITALPTLAPIFVPLGIYSIGGAWKITTSTNVSAIGIGNFT